MRWGSIALTICAVAGGAACSFDPAAVSTAYDGGAGETPDASAQAVDASGSADACVPAPAEVCNGIDDTCEGDIDEGFEVGTPCDGADGDLCNEGLVVCDAEGGAICDDSTGDAVELCNTIDDDCDGAIDEGFNLMNDEQNCGMCGNVCAEINGTNTCTGSVCHPSCDAGAFDCNQNPNDGCELLRDDGPMCQTATDVGSVNGDSTSVPITRTGATEEFFKVRIVESLLNASSPLTATITLTTPLGADFDLYVTCASCNDPRGAQSLSGATVDTVSVGRSDGTGDVSFDLYIEVRYFMVDAGVCGDWTLVITGDTVTEERTCDPDEDP
jgi:hypothetical protein